MEVGKQHKLNFKGVDFVNVVVNVENPLPKEQPIIDFKITPKVFYPEDSTNEFVIIIDTSIVSKGFFNISITGFGFFVIPNLAENIRSEKAFININAPAIMFPYVRSFISTLTANLGSGFVQIVIPPHFFQGDLEEHIDPPKMPTVEPIQQ